MIPSGVPAVVLHLARSLGAGDPTAELAVALACQATQSGHVCADLDLEAGWGPWAGTMDAQERDRFRTRLSELPIVGTADSWTPLVWDGRRLALRRYWDYEQQIASDLRARAEQILQPDAETAACLVEAFADVGQRQAAHIALTHRLCLVSGGPGTGKTHTLARIIGLLQQQAQGSPLRIALAAPTGKAAARMTEALDAAGVAIAGGATTVHRLLGMRADGGGFRHGRDRPLAVDILAIDEASMIDLSLMAHLLDALPRQARLILLGDRDQLAAVEAGAVFADLCASASLADCVATLQTSFRFAGAGGIGQVAEALREGDPDAVVSLLQAGGSDIVWHSRADVRQLVSAAREGYAPYLGAVAAGRPAAALFESFSCFRVLCAHRQDAETINRALAGNTPPGSRAGQPLMILRNDPLLRLFNGDVGIVLPDPADGVVKACFPGDALTGPRWIPVARLPTWEGAWAMTVHKSQGSEFARVMLVLPAAPSAVVSRELAYTGITRARQGVEVWAGEAVLRAAIEHRAERMSGLRDIMG